MKFLTFVTPSNEQRPGFDIDGKVFDIGAAAEAQGISLPTSVLGFLEVGPDAIAQARKLSQHPSASAFLIEDARLAAPIPRPPKILGLAGNFADHIVEGGGRPRPKAGATPDVFMMPSSSVIHPFGAIEIPKVSDAVDYELELAVVIGKRAKNVGVDAAMGYVAGYAIFNDISARKMNYPNRIEKTARDDWFDWLNGKWCDTFAAWGPWLVTADEIADPHDLEMELRVNGELRQKGSTRQMIFNIPETIAFLSDIFTLEPGDLIAMGTPAGVGDASSRYLKPGDVMTGTVAGLGALTNPIAG